MTEILEEADIGNEDEAPEVAPNKPPKEPEKKPFPTRAEGKPIPLEMLPDRMREAFESYGKAISPEDIFNIAAQSGTHLIKLRSGRSKGILKTKEIWGNRSIGLVPSSDAKLAKLSKFIFGIIEVEGQEPRSIVEHIREPNEFTAEVKRVFCSILSEEQWDRIACGLRSETSAIKQVGGSDFPIVFAPDENGNDIQLTPLLAAAAQMAMRSEVSQPYYRKVTKKDPTPPRGRWSDQIISGKPQNVSIMPIGIRRRFDASFPVMQSAFHAQLYKYSKDGRFPSLDEEWFRNELLEYASLSEREESYSNLDIRNALNYRGSKLIEAIRKHIEDVMLEIKIMRLDDGNLSEPRISDVAYSAFSQSSDDIKSKVRTALAREHFKKMLKKFGY